MTDIAQVSDQQPLVPLAAYRPLVPQSSPAHSAEEKTPVTHRLRLTASEHFWYVVQCIAFGAGYLAKVPTKKALSDAGLTQMTGAEKTWYMLQCIAFGAGYFSKVPTKKALSDAGLTQMTASEHFWYVVQCIAFGAGYFSKVPTKKALSELAQIPNPVTPT